MLVSIDKLKSGSTIKADIQDNTGKVVAKAGSKMTPLLIKRLSAWGVKSVDIEPDEQESTLAAANPVEAKPVEKKPTIAIDKDVVIKIAKRFSNVRDDPLMDKIMRLAIKHLSSQQAKKIEQG